MNWTELAGQSLSTGTIPHEDALRVLQSSDEELLQVLDAAYRVRREKFGNKVRCCMLINAQSGNCSEDCAYCSQSIRSTAPIEKYRLVDVDTIVEGSRCVAKTKACHYSIVTSGRGPSEKMMSHVCEAVRLIKAEKPALKICASLGILKPGQAQQLKEAGLERYHHNINTNKKHHEEIVTTHTFQDRLETVGMAHEAGLKVCCGVIVGMGESMEDLVDMACTLRDGNADSIPVNFLAPMEGTPLSEQNDLTPKFCLKVLAMFRLVCPNQELRLAGGREINLRTFQAMAMYAANSLFVGDYLTMDGSAASADHQMLTDLGFEIIPE